MLLGKIKSQVIAKLAMQCADLYAEALSNMQVGTLVFLSCSVGILVESVTCVACRLVRCVGFGTEGGFRLSLPRALTSMPWPSISWGWLPKHRRVLDKQ